MRTRRDNWLWLVLASALAAVGMVQAQTPTETVLYNFRNFPRGADPCGTLFRDSAGDLYGTAVVGGAANLGAVFELTASGKYKLLHSFMGGSDGANPYAGVVLDSAGNLYGTTYAGGTSGKGTVYKVSSSGQESVVYSFTGGTDGSSPYAGVVLDSSGDLYGTTYNGGPANAGVVYKVTPSGQETVLYSFTGGTDGANPYASVTLDSSGNLYGTTYAGGPYPVGVVYKLDKSGRESVLYAFANGPGGNPKGGVILDSAGNLYGVAANLIYKITAAGQYTELASWKSATAGGSGTASLAIDATGNLYGTSGLESTPPTAAPMGAVFKVDTAGQLTVLYRFPGPPNTGVGSGGLSALNPGVVLDSAGNVYGSTPNAGLGGTIYKVSAAAQQTTLYSFLPAPGGQVPFAGVIAGPNGILYGAASEGGAAGAGVIYQFDAQRHERALYTFTAGADGRGPSPVVRDAAGNLYGTTAYGGGTGCSAFGCGVVYKLDPSGKQTVLYTFKGGADGANPFTGVILDAAGNLYGATFTGGRANAGVVYKVDTSGHFTVLHTFSGGADGGVPNGVTLDSIGNVYGTTNGGGRGGGVVFKIPAGGGFTVLYSFTGGADGSNPDAGVTLDSAGNIYGTATQGGTGRAGVIYEISAAGQFAVLYTFMPGAAGDFPSAGLARDSAGNLYGTASGGGTGCAPSLGCGVVYELSPAGQYTVLHNFTGGVDGGQPEEGLLLFVGGNLYGTCPYYGANGAGVLYKLALK